MALYHGVAMANAMTWRCHVTIVPMPLHCRSIPMASALPPNCIGNAAIPRRHMGVSKIVSANVFF